jgi:hypothetical protein
VFLEKIKNKKKNDDYTLKTKNIITTQLTTHNYVGDSAGDSAGDSTGDRLQSFPEDD